MLCIERVIKSNLNPIETAIDINLLWLQTTSTFDLLTKFTQFQLFATMKMSLPIVFSFLGKHFSVLLAFSLPKNCKTN